MLSWEIGWRWSLTACVLGFNFNYLTVCWYALACDWPKVGSLSSVDCCVIGSVILLSCIVGDFVYFLDKFLNLAFRWWLLLAVDFSWKISNNWNMAELSRWLLISGALHYRYCCNYVSKISSWVLLPDDSFSFNGILLNSWWQNV